MKTAFALALLTLLAPLALLAGADEPADPARSATVKVSADGGTGSGAVVGRGGADVYVLTAAHVVPAGKAATVTLPGGKEFKAEVVARDDGPDLAVLRFPAAAAPPALRLAPPGATPKAVASGGWEAGAAPTTRAEAIKTKARVKRPGAAAAVLCWETEQRPAAGRSGGPLADEAGRLVGVAAGHDGATGFYTHADEVRAFLRRSGLNWLTDDR